MRTEEPADQQHDGEGDEHLSQQHQYTQSSNQSTVTEQEYPIKHCCRAMSQIVPNKKNEYMKKEKDKLSLKKILHLF